MFLRFPLLLTEITHHRQEIAELNYYPTMDSLSLLFPNTLNHKRIIMMNQFQTLVVLLGTIAPEKQPLRRMLIQLLRRRRRWIIRLTRLKITHPLHQQLLPIASILLPRRTELLLLLSPPKNCRV